jgi:leucyl aminopeptidase
LWYAREKMGATHLVDVATLTGACVVALGKITSGLFGAPTSWVDEVQRASERAGDRAWPMPVFEEYFDQLKSDIADMTNTGGRPAGAITAALFLEGVHGRSAVGAHGYRGTRGRTRPSLHAEGRDRRGCARSRSSRLARRTGRSRARNHQRCSSWLRTRSSSR